mgnify:FL=1
MLEHQAIYPSAELFLIKQFMQTEGFQAQQWLLGTGLSVDALKRSDTLVSLHQFDIIYRNVFRLVQSPDIGLRFGKALNLSRWGMLTMALTAARSLGSALQTANQHRSLIRSRFNLEPERHGDMVRISITQKSAMPFPVNEVFAFEMLITSLTRQINDLLVKPFYFNKIQLHYPPPKHFRHYTQHCGCPIEFNTPTSALWLPESTLASLLPLANQMTERQALDNCDMEMQRVDKIQKGDIRWMVSAELGKGHKLPLDLDSLASHLSMNARTLRRRLQSAGTNYRELYQQHQLQLALQALANTHKGLEEIAKTCGFKDSASFRNAFIRWTNITPSKYRTQF